MFVLDCSVAAAWLFEDEASEATDALLRRLRHDGAVVPGLALGDCECAGHGAQARAISRLSCLL